MSLSKRGMMIAELRREKELTQQDVAESLGIRAKTVSKWETGHGFESFREHIESLRVSCESSRLEQLSGS